MVLEGFDEFVTGKQDEPSDVEWIWYLFFTNGIGYNEFEQLPIPYIMGILKAHKKKNDEEQKELKRIKKR